MVAGHVAKSGRAGDTTGRPRGHGEHRTVAGGGNTHHAAVGGHDLDRRVNADGGQVAPQMRQVAPHCRQDVGVDHGGAGALVLFHLRQHFAGGAHQQLRILRFQNLLGRQFMQGIGIAVDKTDRHRLHAFVQQKLRHLAHLLRIERTYHAAIGGNALIDLAAIAPRREWLGLGPGQVEHGGGADTTDFQHVAKAARGQHRSACADLLQDGVGGGGGAVHHFRDGGRIGAGGTENGADALDHGTAGVVRGGGGLVDMQAAIGQCCHDVGEGAAYVTTNAHWRCP